VLLRDADHVLLPESADLALRRQDHAQLQGRWSHAGLEPLVEREAQGLLERMDDWLATREVESGAAAAPLRLGIGLYAIHDSAGDVK
jgi:hypothetical protein